MKWELYLKGKDGKDHLITTAGSTKEKNEKLMQMFLICALNDIDNVTEAISARRSNPKKGVK